MNIAFMESSSRIEAKTCGCRQNDIKVAYSFIDTYHSLYLSKKDIILGQMGACETLLKDATDKMSKDTIIKEITELKMTLDLLS